MFGAGVPETAVHEHGDALAPEHHVRLSAEVGQRTRMDAESKPLAMKGGSQGNFNRRVALRRRLHAFASSVRGGSRRRSAHAGRKQAVLLDMEEPSDLKAEFVKRQQSDGSRLDLGHAAGRESARRRDDPRLHLSSQRGVQLERVRRGL